MKFNALRNKMEQATADEGAARTQYRDAADQLTLLTSSGQTDARLKLDTKNPVIVLSFESRPVTIPLDDFVEIVTWWIRNNDL